MSDTEPMRAKVPDTEPLRENVSDAEPLRAKLSDTEPLVEQVSDAEPPIFNLPVTEPLRDKMSDREVLRAKLSDTQKIRPMQKRKRINTTVSQTVGDDGIHGNEKMREQGLRDRTSEIDIHSHVHPDHQHKAA